MCGRYASFLPAEAVARLFHTVNPIPNLPPTWNMAPTQDAMVVRHHPETGERHLDLLKWGLLPFFTKDPSSCEAADQCTSRDGDDIGHVQISIRPTTLHGSCRRIL
jgi:putative SOS response-associated peptidase YedK